jgi:tetratricopeptide (TPR) repeat protein
MSAELVVQDEPAATVMMVCPACNATYETQVEVCPADGSGLLEVPRAALLTGALLDDRYQIGKVIGSGGMGTVYRAYQPSMDRAVAVKVLHPQYAHEPRAVKRFFREAQSASRLLHPNIVTVYDFGRSSDGHLYMVMELVEGWTLGDLIYYRAPLEPALVISIACQVCDALAEAHRRRTVHRDLKPDNVQLTTVRERVLAKVLDFGIARVVRDSEARLDVALSTVDIAGTPAYMSPEQVLGKDPDPRSDLYSLGVILFEMLAGERPFADDTSMTLCMKQIHDAPPRLGDMPRTRHVPRPLEGLVAQLLLKDPETRPASAEEVKRLLLTCPEAAHHVDFTQVVQALGQAALEMPTRPDAGAMMALPTLDAGSALEIGPTGARLAEVLSRLELEVPDRGEAPRPGGRRPSEPTQLRVSAAAKPRPASAILHLVAGDPALLRRADVVAWLTERQASGWALAPHPVGPVGMTLRVPLGDGAEPVDRVLAAAAGEILALSHQIGLSQTRLKAGLSAVTEGGEAQATDLARRLAATGWPGALAMPADLAGRLGLRGRPLTGIFLPDGKPLACASIGETATGAGGVRVDRIQGRGPVLRRFSQIVEEARRAGPQRVALVGPPGIGKTATARACVATVPHVALRVSPVAPAWPGHTAARLLRLLLGLADARDEASLEVAIQTLPHRDRELCALLALDRAADEKPTVSEIAAVLVSLLEQRADEGPFAVVLDDAHHLDPASTAIFDAVLGQAINRPWIWLVTRTEESVRTEAAVAPGGSAPTPASRAKIEHTIDLRPLGVRACIAMQEELDIEERRHLPLAGVSAGNPLALILVAALPVETPLPAPDRVILSLLPEALRQLQGADAAEAWLDAVFGVEENDRRRVQAARRYLELGPPEAIARWLADSVRKTGGVYADLATHWEAPRPSYLVWRAEREVRLGLHAQAEESYLRAAQASPDKRRLLELEAAQMRLFLGDAPGALERFEACFAAEHPSAGRGSGLPTSALCRFAAALLSEHQDTRAEELLAWLEPRVQSAEASALAAEIQTLVARAAVRRQDHPAAQRALARSRELVAVARLSDARGARALEALGQEVRAELARALGDAQGARTNLRQACDAFRDLARPSDAIRCLVELGRIELDLKHTSRAADTFRAAVRLAAAGGLRSQLRAARVGLGRALAAGGNLDEGAQILRACLREASGRGADPSGFVEAALGLAHVMLVRGLDADAERYAQRALAAARHEADRGRCHRVLFEVKEASGHRRQASAHLNEARRAAHRTGDGFFVGELAEPRL